MQNIEIKARLQDRVHAARVCGELGASPEGDLRQTDTYFCVPRGRLKLREFGDGQAELIFYHRPDVSGPKRSDYEVQPVPQAMGPLLAHALGTVAVVKKTRSLYLWENVRIHLDRVEGLGDFLEFEAAVTSESNEQICRERVDDLMQAFAISPDDLLEVSYLDMMTGSPA